MGIDMETIFLDDFVYEGIIKESYFREKINSIEWLYLAAKGHRRAKLDLENNKEFWLVP